MNNIKKSAMKYKEKMQVNILIYIGIIFIISAMLIYLDFNKSGDTFTVANTYWISLIQKFLVYAVVALSMNLVNGFTGLFSLGQAGFMALGAYTTAIFTIPLKSRAGVYYMNGIAPVLKDVILPIPLAIIIGGIIAALFAALIGIPVLRLKSDYLAVATLGFSEIIRAVIQSPMMDQITNGSFGLNKIPTFGANKIPIFYNQSFPAFECFVYCLIPIVLMALIINSSTGRDFKAIREDEIAARAVGINIFKTKELSFVVSSFFTGIAGGLLAMHLRTMKPGIFSTTLTYEILLIVVLGGIGSITGSIVGAFVVTFGQELLRFFDEPLTINGVNIPLFRPGFRMVIYSFLLMVVVLFFRKGLLGGRELSLNRFKKFRRGKNSDYNSEGGNL